MFDIVREMRERKGEIGRFEVFDGQGVQVGHALFTYPEEYLATAESTWGKIEVRSSIEEGKQVVSVDGSPLATLVVAGLASKVLVRMVSGQELTFKHAAFSDVYRYKGTLGTAEFRFRKVLDMRKTAECKVIIDGYSEGKPEDLALALMSWYGFMHVSSRDVIRDIDRWPS
jgi:hypothetical protein